MEEYLRRVQSRAGAGQFEGPIHAVLGGPEPDVNTVAATLCLALHLSQRQPSGGVCVPVLCRKRCSAALPEETGRYLQRVKISESLLLWKEDVDLVNLHRSGKLLLTLLSDGLLDSSERSTLESSVLRVVHHGRQRDAVDDGTLSVLMTVAREILQEAAEQSRAALGEALVEALRLQREASWIKRGCRSDELEELVSSLELWGEGRQQDLMQLLAMKLKEFSNGEMTVALTSLTTAKEAAQDYVEGLTSFSHQHGFDALVVLLTVSESVHHPRQQVAVFSNNTDILNQICTELEECSSWSLSSEPEDTACLQVYHISMNTSAVSGSLPLLEEDIQDLLKDFVARQSSVLSCHPSSRTSSTEGVAGSVEFSQGSSGINDMDGSDVERTEGGIGDVVAVARVMEEHEEDTAGVHAGGEILSPDSGMTTIRSSRSSKESSVFLSDESPLGEVTASGGPAAAVPGGLRNPSPLGFLSLSPPVPPERRKHRSSRNRNDNFSLFSFDPFHSSDQPLSAGGGPVNSQGGGDEGERRAGSSSLSELDELSSIDFSAPSSLRGLESGHSSVDHQGMSHGNEMMETMVPPTPVNSLVGSRPPSSCGVRFFPEDVIERINVLQHKDSMSSSLSETWDELSFDAQGALSSTENTLNRPKSSGSPQTIECETTGKDSDFTEKYDRDQISKPEADHQRVKSLEPQLSLVIEQTEMCEDLNPDFVLQDQWRPVTLADLQLTLPEKGVTVKSKAEEDVMPSLKKTKPILSTLTPDTSKEEGKSIQGKKDQQLGLLDFWTYSAQHGFLQSDSETITSYPESLEMWNMTIRDDSLSPLTTPDNLSENSGSFYGLNPNIRKDNSEESPPGYSDGGMQMWNTTIQEDSSSTLTTPEGPENEKDLSHVGSLDESLETHLRKHTEEEKASEDGIASKFLKDALEKVEWIGNEHNVKIVIETVDSETRGEETSSTDSIQSQYSEVIFSETPSKHSEDENSPYQTTGMWELPVHGMVTSTSEYDNLGPGAWSQASSPDICASPIIDMIQIEEQSSPFIAVSKPIQSDESQNLSQTADLLRTTKTLDMNQTANQVFLFDKEFGPRAISGDSPKSTSRDESEELNWTEQSSEHSPFVLVDTSTFSQQDSESPREAAETQNQTRQSLSLSCDDCDVHVSEHKDSESASSLCLKLPIKISHSEDETAFETQEHDAKECNEKMGGKITDLSLECFSVEEREVFNSLDTRSQNNLESKSDENLFSGLEMENIVVSGSVKEASRGWSDQVTQDSKQSTGTRKSMETFSILSFAATVLKTRAQTAHQDPIESPCQDSQQQLVPEMISLSQSITNSEAFGTSDGRPTEEENKNESSAVGRSVSPSLRYPSDHFLKTREEVYVHSQISMEDSDEGGESPSAPEPSATSLGDFQVWGGQLVRKETPSPLLTNSSVSQSSSLISSPVNELSISTDKTLGLPFSGDLMEEEQDNDLDSDHSTLPKRTPEKQGELKERQEFESSDLMSFTEDLIAGSSFQQTDLQMFESKGDTFLPNREDYYPPQPLRADKWSVEQHSGGYEVPEDINSPVLRRHQDVTSQLSSQPNNENAAYLNTTQGQTKYGYNFHHIDQRTENQSASQACADTKPENQHITEVYAELTTDALVKHFRPEQSENQFETGPNAHHSPDDTHVKRQHAAENLYEDDSACTSELQYSQHRADEQSHYDSENVHYQYDGEPFHQAEAHPKTEDHARYVPEEYVYFLHSRNSQQGVDAAGMMMMKMASSEEAAEELDNREDPPSSADTSAGSNGRRKLSAPPMNVSLEHSEGSLLSEDALDTEDDALDTGDDLDVSVDGIDTPDETDSLELNGHADSDESNLGEGAASGGATAGHQAEERGDKRLWRSVVIGEQEHRIDMKCIEPYKRVISHGGYYAEKNAIIVFAACFLPDSDCESYNYVMENLFLYVISTLELMVAEDYMIVYLNGATPRRRMPGFSWMKRCYQMIDRRLKKNLKMFFIVHPSWFVRTLLGITRPFISSKFSSKIKYVNSLKELGELIPMEYVHIPPSIIKLDLELKNTSATVDKGSSAV